ncbi:MAG: carboxypeptidase regulatory-like domain-containing protein, partial [Prevotella sp.]
MNKKLLTISMLAASMTVAAQDTISVSGTVTDAATGKPLAGVSVEAYGNNRFTAMTDEEGRYELKVPEYVSSVAMRVDGYLMQQR